MMDLLEQIRDLCASMMQTSPKRLWRAVMDVDDDIDLLKYRLERLHDKMAGVALDD